MVASRVTPVVVGDGPTAESAGYECTRRTLREHVGMTAVFAADDLMAMWVIAAVRDAGLLVSEGVSVIGHDELPLASSPLVRLTTVDPHSDQVGRRAAERLVARIERRAPDEDGPGASLVTPLLIDRSITAPAPT